MKFGMWEVLRSGPLTKRKQPQVWCRCECGTERVVECRSLRLGKSTNCGCVRRRDLSKRLTKHGAYDRRTYHVWWGMVQRCQDPTHKAYPDYGGRGISVCDRWLDVRNFVNDMGPRPDGDSSLDRIDSSKGYTPDNCRWATWTEQIRHRTITVHVWYRDKMMPLAEAFDIMGISYALGYSKWTAGWNIDVIDFWSRQRKSPRRASAEGRSDGQAAARL